jgi:hypothetical protein
MPTELRWIVSTAASSLHAASALVEGAPLADQKIAAALQAETQGLGHDLAAIGLEPRLFFEHAIPLSVQYDVPLELAHAILSKLAGPEPMHAGAATLSRRLIALEAALEQAHPGGLAELELRAQPLGEQWEARGPGLLAMVARLTESDLLVSQADVILVQPVQGGGGAAHWNYNSVRIETVLANPVEQLPEVVRLGWLLAQLNMDLPKFQGDMRRDALAEIGPLAMIPPVLAAAQEVELARCDLPTLAAALKAWQTGPAEPGVLIEWWDTYQTARPAWTVALGALARLLAGDTPAGESP